MSERRKSNEQVIRNLRLSLTGLLLLGGLLAVFGCSPNPIRVAATETLTPVAVAMMTDTSTPTATATATRTVTVTQTSTSTPTETPQPSPTMKPTEISLVPVIKIGTSTDDFLENHWLPEGKNPFSRIRIVDIFAAGGKLPGELNELVSGPWKDKLQSECNTKQAPDILLSGTWNASLRWMSPKVAVKDNGTLVNSIRGLCNRSRISQLTPPPMTGRSLGWRENLNTMNDLLIAQVNGETGGCIVDSNRLLSVSGMLGELPLGWQRDTDHIDFEPFKKIARQYEAQCLH